MISLVGLPTDFSSGNMDMPAGLLPPRSHHFVYLTVIPSPAKIPLFSGMHMGGTISTPSPLCFALDGTNWHDSDAYQTETVDYRIGEKMVRKKLDPLHPGGILDDKTEDRMTQRKKAKVKKKKQNKIKNAGPMDLASFEGLLSDMFGDSIFLTQLGL
jgi:hypothetical protein